MDRKKAVPLNEDAMNEDLLDLDIDALPAKGEIPQSIEQEIAKNYSKVSLDASLPAVHLYESLGYRTVSHEKYPVDNDAILVYEIMEKELIPMN